MSHTEFTRLLEDAAGRLTAGESRKVSEHNSVCTDCRAESQVADTLWQTVRSDRMVEPSADLVSRAVSLWKLEHPGVVSRTVRSGVSRARQAVEIIRAVLVFDSFASKSPATVGAVRSGSLDTARNEPRRMLFRAGDIDIDLAIERPLVKRSGKFRLRGQILGAEGVLGEIALGDLSVGKVKGRARRAQIDRNGSFQVDSLDGGLHSLSLKTSSRHIVLQGLDLN